MRFRIDPNLYAVATPEREREWRVALTDLNADADGQPPTLTLLRRDDGGVAVEVAFDVERELIPFHHDVLRPHFRDYRAIIEQLVRSSSDLAGLRQLETLDYAKKLVHDEAGEMVQRHLGQRLAIEHRMARRLFTLIFLVSTELPEHLVTRHRHR